MPGLAGHARSGDRFSGHSALSHAIHNRVKMRGFWRMEAREAGFIANPKTGLWVPGPIIRIDEWENLVVNQGLNNLLDVHLSAGTQITSWFLALLKTGGGSIAAGSTYQNFMGTANQEVTAYDEANRVAWTDGGASSQSISNSGSPAVFTISANGTTIGGAALVSNNTKNDTTAGRFMYAGGAFSGGDLVLNDNATLTVTATFTGADDGV